MRIDPETCRDPDLLASEVRRLRTVIAAGFPAPENAAQPESLTDAEREALNDGIYLCESAAGTCNENANATAWATAAERLRGLRERLLK